ncbi:hypothetical protein CCACVL1_05356, partial [Corchorus capsularis]
PFQGRYMARGTVFSSCGCSTNYTLTGYKLWDDNDGSKKPSSLLFPCRRRLVFADDGASDHPIYIFDWKSGSTSRQ